MAKQPDTVMFETKDSCKKGPCSNDNCKNDITRKITAVKYPDEKPMHVCHSHTCSKKVKQEFTDKQNDKISK